MADSDTTFHDPDLKAAIERLRGGHTARPELVERVSRALAAADGAAADHEVAGAGDVAGRPMLIGRPTRWARLLAVAASVLIVATVVGMILKVRHDRHEAEEYLEANAGLLREMAAAHADGIPAGASVQALPTGDGAGAVRDRAAGLLGRYVPLPGLSDAGWTLARAAVCPFGAAATPAGRFEFTRGAARVTLLSLPAAAFTGAHEGDTYETTVDGQPIAGFVSRGGIHCVVGDRGAALSDLVALRDRLRRG